MMTMPVLQAGVVMESNDTLGAAFVLSETVSSKTNVKTVVKIISITRICEVIAMNGLKENQEECITTGK